jgi:hypothetical protein
MYYPVCVHQKKIVSHYTTKDWQYKTSVFSYVTMITAQNDLRFLHVSKIICLLSDTFIISPYTVSRLHDPLQEFSCVPPQ